MDVLRSSENTRTIRRSSSSSSLASKLAAVVTSPSMTGHCLVSPRASMASPRALMGSPRASAARATTPRSSSRPRPSTPRTTPRSSPNKDQDPECDYDVDPTKLYIYIQRKKWEEATERAKAHSEECQTWVSRKEDNGTLRWRLLPLHAAIIFKAPEKVIHALLVSYPFASHKKDDQGMLPIHSAVRNESPVSVVQFLLMAYPGSVKVADRKGRLPFAMIQNSRSALKNRYMEAHNMTDFYYSVTKASVESESLANLRKHADVGTQGFDAEKINLLAKIDALEADLDKTQNASEILVNHITTLEAKLSSNNDSEGFLASKIAKLDSELREATRAKQLVEAQAMREHKNLTAENEKLTAKVLELEQSLFEASLKDKSVAEAIETELTHKNSLQERYKAMEKENAKCKAEVESMEEILRKKIASENSLANQVSSLASRLAESTADTCTSSNTFERRINILTEEKATMQSKLDMLTVKVQSVLKTLSLMSKEHDRILQLSTMHAETMETAQKHQESLAANAARNEQMMIDAAWEREEICRILTKQAKQVEKSTEERNKLMKEVKEQNAKMSQVNKSRGQLVDSIKEQQGRMASLMEDINVLKEFAVDDSHFFLDETMNATNNSMCSDLDETTAEEKCEAAVSSKDKASKPTVETIQEKSEQYLDDDSDDDAGIILDTSSDDSQISFDDEDEKENEGAIEYDNDDLVSAMTQSVDLIVVQSDSENSLEDDQDENLRNNMSLGEIESSVDILCSEAARLVAKMPKAKRDYP